MRQCNAKKYVYEGILKNRLQCSTILKITKKLRAKIVWKFDSVHMIYNFVGIVLFNPACISLPLTCISVIYPSLFRPLSLLHFTMPILNAATQIDKCLEEARSMQVQLSNTGNVENRIITK